MNIREEIKEIIKRAAQTAFGTSEIPDFSVSAAENPAYGDYAANIAFALSKVLKKKTMDVAERLAGSIKHDLFSSVSPAAPGFLNITLDDGSVIERVAASLQARDAWGASDAGRGKTAMVDYFQLNIAKRPHVGHLRSAVIGDSLKRMFLSQGYHAVSDTHVGDWGTQFGILLLAYKEHRENKEYIETGDPFDLLEKLYIEENEKIEQDPARRDLAKAEFAKLEAGDEENRKIWEWMVDVSMKKLEETAHRLGLLPFDEHKGESAYEAGMKAILMRAQHMGVAKQTPDGAVVVDLAAENLDEAVLVKSDGASTYLLRDLATIEYRKNHWKFWKNLYVVDVRQSHHFRQLFRVAEMLGLEGPRDEGLNLPSGAVVQGGHSEHVEFGFMKLPEGAMSTRKGTTIALDTLFDETEKRARAVIAEKNPNLPDADAVARSVGMGALKYFDLSHHRKSDIVFRWEDALSFDGNTGPYLQYTYARLKSILRKASKNIQSIENIEVDVMEHRLALAVLQYPEAIADALEDYAPSMLANYLFHFAQLANEFYHSHPVTQEEDAAKKNLRLTLVAAVSQTLKNGLGLLGIDAPGEM